MIKKKRLGRVQRKHIFWEVKMKRICCHLRQEQIAKIKKEAIKRHMSMAAIIRLLINNGLNDIWKYI